MKKLKFDLFAVTALGLESVCARELTALGLADVVLCKGGVAFQGGLEELYRANLWLRSATRVLVRLGSFGCKDFPDLYRKALRLPWGRFVKPGTRMQVKATSHGSRLMHTGRIAETVLESAGRVVGAESVSQDTPAQLIMVRFEDNQCQISIDSSGELLHRRGYRKTIGMAPMRETLAAGILMMLNWDGSTPLVDPMCGSGTFIVEGALMGTRCPPGLTRDFAFMQWPRYRPGLWNVLQTQARSAKQLVEGPLIGRDRDPVMVEAARCNATRAGVEGVTLFEPAELGKGDAPTRAGVVLCNPPYGGRLGHDEALTELYRQLGDVYRSVYRGWQGAVLCPVGPLSKALGEGFDCLHLLSNGGLEVGLHVARL